MRHLPLLAAAALLASCGAPSGDQGLDQGLSDLVASWQVLDLDTGATQSRSSLADLQTNAEYRDRKMVFRLVEPTTATVGSDPAGFGAQADEARQQVALGRYYLAVFEVTQAQWQRLAGTTPWTAVDAAVAGGAAAIAGDRPAFNSSAQQAAQILTAWNAGRRDRLALPSAAQWEAACRAGATTTYPWGEARDEATVAAHAVTWEVSHGQGGARRVGDRAANAWGFFDMIGNVWEFTDDGLLRGGSWCDDLPQARAANRTDLTASVPYPSAGLRPILLIGN